MSAYRYSPTGVQSDEAKLLGSRTPISDPGSSYGAPSLLSRLGVRLRLRNPFTIALSTALLCLLYVLWSPHSLQAGYLKWEGQTDPLSPLPPFRERLRLAQKLVPHYTHQRHIWQSAKSAPREPAADAPEAAWNLWRGWLSWEEKNPGWEHHFVGDGEMEHHILALAAAGVPEVLAVYRSMPKIVLKSDFLRYVLIFMHGGVWTDNDTRCHRPISEWVHECAGQSELDSVGLIAGTELDGGSFLDRDLFFSQFTFAARAGHPVLLDVISNVVEWPDHEGSYENILKWTGPRQWTDAITHHLATTIDGFEISAARNLGGPAFFRDVCIVPIYAFGSGRGTVSKDDPRIWAEHFFEGSWTRR